MFTKKIVSFKSSLLFTPDVSGQGARDVTPDVPVQGIETPSPQAIDPSEKAGGTNTIIKRVWDNVLLVVIAGGFANAGWQGNDLYHRYQGLVSDSNMLHSLDEYPRGSTLSIGPDGKYVIHLAQTHSRTKAVLAGSASGHQMRGGGKGRDQQGALSGGTGNMAGSQTPDPGLIYLQGGANIETIQYHAGEIRSMQDYVEYRKYIKTKGVTLPELEDLLQGLGLNTEDNLNLSLKFMKAKNEIWIYGKPAVSASQTYDGALDFMNAKSAPYRTRIGVIRENGVLEKGIQDNFYYITESTPSIPKH